MRGWKKISLFKFQQVERIMERKDLDDIDKTFSTVSVVYDITHHELDNYKLKKALKLSSKVKRIFESKIEARAKGRIGKYFINYDPSKMCFGQYVELSFFLSIKKPIHHAHYVLASISNLLMRKNDASHHSKKAEYFLHRPVVEITGSLSFFIERFNAFNAEYKSLFGLNVENAPMVESHPFNKRYGWTFSATQVAGHNRITLDEAFALPVRQALNDLMYLKEKSSYDESQLKKS